jgi:hypothetical protein
MDKTETEEKEELKVFGFVDIVDKKEELEFFRDTKMDKEQKRKLIAVAKSALKRTKSFPLRAKFILIRTHNHYLDEAKFKYERSSDMPVMWEQGKKICTKFLKESKGNHYLFHSRLAVKRDLHVLKVHLEMTKEEGFYSAFRPVRSRGRRTNMSLYHYVSRLAIWFNAFGGKPGYGASSVFTHFVTSCLSVLDESYLDSPPEKIIRRVLMDLRKEYPNGLPPLESLA